MLTASVNSWSSTRRSTRQVLYRIKQIYFILENEAAEIDKKTVLDLCAHMFHPKDTSLDNSETLELNELKTEDRIREYENEQGELIFECFQDEVS